ncbi:hypothetical protein LOS22_00325 [Enterococcus faecium]|nr:hypothetical protein [Enterococcus faecium]
MLIDTLDNPLTKNINGTLKYVDQWHYGIQETQLKWIAEQALGTLPEDYHVLFTSHVPIMPETVTTDPIVNGNLLKQLIKAFIEKKEIQLTSNVEDFSVNFSVDFSSRAESLLVGFLQDIDMQNTSMLLMKWMAFILLFWIVRLFVMMPLSELLKKMPLSF